MCKYKIQKVYYMSEKFGIFMPLFNDTFVKQKYLKVLSSSTKDTWKLLLSYKIIIFKIEKLRGDKDIVSQVYSYKIF